MLTNYEKETIIIFNEAEQTASVFTYNSRWMRKLDAMAEQREEVWCVRTEEFEGHTAKEYFVPKTWIKCNAPRTLSEETKEKMAERMRMVREGKS